MTKKVSKKVKNERQLQFFSRAKSLRNAAEKIVVHTVRSLPRAVKYELYSTDVDIDWQCLPTL